MYDRLIAAGVAPTRLIRDEDSLTTLQNGVAVAREVAKGGYALVISCSDGWHLPRIGLTLAMLGVRSMRGPVPAGRDGVAWGRWIAMSLRECVAIPVYLAILIVRRGWLRP